jgi:hypothetical protein
MPQTLHLALSFLYITPLPSSTSPLSRPSKLPSPPYRATAGSIAPPPPLITTIRYNHRL